LSVFPNAKSQLLGEAEDSIAIIDTVAIAELSGDVIGVDPVNNLGYATPIGSGGTANITTAEIVYGSTSLNATKSINKGFIRNTQGVDYPSSNTITVRMREDDINGNIIVSTAVGGGSSVMDISTVITNQTIGNKTYVFTAQLGNPIFGDFIRTHSDPTTLSYIVDIDDTHAAAITTPATAIKQINSADSHVTQETQVIS